MSITGRDLCGESSGAGDFILFLSRNISHFEMKPALGCMATLEELNS